MGGHVHDTVRIDLVCHQELVAGRQFIVDFYDGITIDDLTCRACHIEVTA